MSTPCLIDVQRWVRDYLLTQKSEIEKNAVKLNPQGTSTGVDRLAVYAQGYVARIEEALREAYPAVEVVIGHEKFHVLAREYGIRVKSHSYNLSSVGNRLPQHLYKHDLLSQYPYLRDLARLEWALTESFHARSEPSVDAAVLARITPERWPILKFQFKSHVKLVDVTHPVLEVWLQAKQKKTINEPDKKNQYILIYRHDYEVKCVEVDQVGFTVLEALMRGATLEEALTSVENESETIINQLQQWFRFWMSLELIHKIEN